MVKDRLRERLATSGSAKLAVETERLHDRQVGLDREHGRADTLLFAEDLATTPVEDGVDTANSVLGALDLDEVDGLLESRVGEQAGGVADTTASGDNLSSTTVDGIGVKLFVEGHVISCRSS